MKSEALAFAFLLLGTASAAMAGQCDADLAAVDRALSDASSGGEQRAQIEDMRKQAADLCTQGNEEEGLDVLAEAKAILGLE